MKFKCRPAKEVYMSENFKIYGCYVDSNKYKELELNKYGMITIKGNFQKLDVDVEYDIVAERIEDNYGVSYKVENIRRPKILDISDAKNFLKTITTNDRADAILEVYPNIIDMIVKDRYEEIDVSNIRGVGEVTLEKIKEKVEENYMYIDSIEKFSDIFSKNLIKKLHKIYKSTERIEEELYYRPYDCLCKVDRVGFKKADSLLLGLEKQSKKMIAEGKQPRVSFGQELSTSYQRFSSCINYILIENESNGNTYMGFKQLFNSVKALVPEAYTDRNIKLLQDESEIIFIRELFGVARKVTAEVENYIASRVVEAISERNKWDIDYSKYKKTGDVELSNEQFSVLDLVCSNSLMILNGFAGTGKSQTIRSVIEMCDNNNKTYTLLSTTGKASKVLAKFTGKPASTIHKCLGLIPTQNNNNKKKKIISNLVVVDEFGMCDIHLFKTLLEAIDFKYTKLLLVGDSAQLPSVNCGNLLHDLLEFNCVNKVTLSKVFRYDSDGLSMVTTDTRKGKKYITNSEINSNEKVLFRGKDKNYVLINVQKNKIITQVEYLFEKLIKSGVPIDDICVITGYNSGEFGIEEINKRIQKIVNINCINNSHKKFIFNGTSFYVGDHVIHKRNNYQAKLYLGNCDDAAFIDDVKNMTCVIANGETGIIKDIIMINGKQHVLIDFDGVIVDFTKKEMEYTKLAYSITIHSSQGSSIKIPILLTPSAHTYMLNSNLLYVGVSRAKLKCYHITDKLRTINTCVKKKADFSRNTLLNYFLKINAR